MRARREQPWLIRLTHWLNVPVLAIMAGSGLQILAACPQMGPRGELYRWYPLQGFTAPEWLQVGGWLAGGRAFHFAFAWLLVVNGAIYLSYLFVSGEWRRRYFSPKRDFKNAVQTAAHYLRLRKEAPPQELYNGLQRLAYSSVPLFGLVAVLSGLAIYKPVQLWWLTVPFGGYDGARVVHFATLAVLVLFTVGHVLMVLLHPRTIPTIITGGKRE
ncbi:MAG: cytochrome b/b6 domain-containing protein [Myxococcaceae bacterium]